MRIQTLIHLGRALSVGALTFTLAALVINSKVTHEEELFKPQTTECVPTNIRNDYHWTSGIPQKTQYLQPEAQDLMNELVRYTRNIPTQDTAPIISCYDAQILMAIASSEAEIDGVEGMAAVIQVVLNRISSDQYPNTIEEVVTQSTTLEDGRVVYQFSPVDIGTYFTVTPSVDAHLALAEVEKGNYQWLDALYFENAEDSWQAKNCEYICTIGHHRFYK